MLNRSGEISREPSSLATGRGRILLALLCAVAFLDFIDASIVNVALPAMRAALGFSVAGLQWPSPSPGEAARPVRPRAR